MHKIRFKFTNSEVSSGIDVHGSKKKSPEKSSPPPEIIHPEKFTPDYGPLVPLEKIPRVKNLPRKNSPS